MFSAHFVLDFSHLMIKLLHMPTLKLPADGVFGSTTTVLCWRKRVGERVDADQVVLQVETDQGVFEIAAPVAGTLTAQAVSVGEQITSGSILGEIDGAPAAAQTAMTQSPQNPPARKEQQMEKPAAPAGPVTPILMPQAGQSMEEGVLVKWHVQPGATIKQGDVIFEIETDKATMDVEATDSGRLARIVVQEGGFSPVLQPVAYLAENDSDVDAYLAQQGGGQAQSPSPQSAEPDTPQSASASAGGTTQPVQPQGEAGRIKASPAARKIAAERGVDLASVAMGSGPGGRVLSGDVPAAPATPVAQGTHVATERPAPHTSAPTRSPSPVPKGAEAPAGAVRKRLSSMRKAIARNLSLSKSTIPHWYLSARVDAGPLLSFYKGQKAKYPCSLNDVIVMACARAMVEFPMFRSRFDDDAILEFPTANIGVAVGMDDGLVVPVVLGAESYTLERLGAETRRLAATARAGKIENMGLGTFTISNLGMFGVDEFVAIVNPPEAAILAVGAAQDDVIVKDGAMKLGKVMRLTLSSDHRLIDGTLGAQFMARLKALLENPVVLLT